MARYWVPGGNGNTSSSTNWSDTSGGASGFSSPTITDDAFFDANSGSGTATINAALSCLSLNCTGFTGTLGGSFNLTIGGNLTWGSTMSLTYNGALNISASSTITPNGINFTGSFSIAPNNATITLSGGDCYVTNLSIGANNRTISISGNKFQVSGNVTFANTSATLTGTTVIRMIGSGTIQSSGITDIRLPIEIDTTGDIVFGSYMGLGTGASLDFISYGSVTTEGSTLGFNSGGITLNSNNVVWNNIITAVTAGPTVTNNSPLYVKGTLTLGLTNQTFTINGSPVYVNNGKIVYAATTGIVTGTSDIYCNNSDISFTQATSGGLRNNLIVFGKSNWTGNFYYNTGTITNNGEIKAKKVNFTSSLGCTLIDFHKVPMTSVTIGGTRTITMNQFFSGSAEIKTRIQSDATTNYIIAFQDGFEKLAKFVRVSNCTISNRGQLLITTDKGNANINGTSNLGVRYINHTPNGISKNNPSVKQQVCFGIEDGFVADPIMR